MAYSQHQSNYNAFFSIRKTHPQASDNNIGVHFFSKQNLDGLQSSTRFYKNRTGEWLQLNGIFVDGLDDVTITNISLQEPKEMDNGTKIPEQIVIDVNSPISGKVDRIQIASDSKWGNDFARKIISADLTKPISIKPYAYIPEGKTKLTEGLTITQDGEKIADYYVKFNGKEKPANINGVEEFDKFAEEAGAETNEKLRSNAWKTYFTKVNVFVIGKMMEFVNKSNFSSVSENIAEEEIVDEETF